MLVRTLTTSAGRHNFAPGMEIDLPDADVKELVEANAVKVVAAAVPEPEKKAEGNKSKAKE